jgi:protein SCO1/2
LQGDDLGGTPAPNFTLTDQNGQQVSLAQFRGKPVILTFLYTHCPDACPLTAEHLHQSMQQLGSDASKIGVIAVSTDPVGDTPSAARSFSQAHTMQDYWHYLIGSNVQLSPVWKAYNIDVQGQSQSMSMSHSLALYVIDKQGHERAFFSSTDFTPDQITKDMRILLQE